MAENIFEFRPRDTTLKAALDTWTPETWAGFFLATGARVPGAVRARLRGRGPASERLAEARPNRAK
jgi:hypothetical protein